MRPSRAIAYRFLKPASRFDWACGRYEQNRISTDAFETDLADFDTIAVRSHGHHRGKPALDEIDMLNGFADFNQRAARREVCRRQIRRDIIERLRGRLRSSLFLVLSREIFATASPPFSPLCRPFDDRGPGNPRNRLALEIVSGALFRCLRNPASVYGDGRLLRNLGSAERGDHVRAPVSLEFARGLSSGTEAQIRFRPLDLAP